MPEHNPRDVWLVLPDLLSTRIMVGTGIIDRLRASLGDRLVVVPWLSDEEIALFEGAVVAGATRDELAPARVGGVERIFRRIDDWLDRRFGFFPLAIRFNYRYGFHLERMQPDHPNRFLDTSRVGPLPRWRLVDATMARWYFSRRRYVPTAMLDRMRRECGAVVLSNVQINAAGRFLTSARRLGVPAVGYVASWDHPVGKGVMSPHLDRYIVQNEIMRADLERYHGIAGGRVVVTGWPQSDVFEVRRTADAYAAVLAASGLAPDKPVVLVTGNSPTNAPYEGEFVTRLVSWWETNAADRSSLLFRPHPRDSAWRDRYRTALETSGVGVQAPSYTDMDALATLLQHVAAVITNAGTILLDSLVNDRPTICVTYDEGAPGGEEWAAKNILGKHYREVLASGAFRLAGSFEEVIGELEAALADPTALTNQRAALAASVLGTVDGRATERVVTAMLEVVG